MLPVQWYELSAWNADPPQRDEDHDTHSIAVEYVDSSHDSWVCVVTLRKQPGEAYASGGGILPTSIDDARGWAIVQALTAISPNHWSESPYGRAEFKDLHQRFNAKATDPGSWRPLELRIGEEARSAYTCDLPHGAQAIAADTGAYFVAIGARGVQPRDLVLVPVG